MTGCRKVGSQRKFRIKTETILFSLKDDERTNSMFWLLFSPFMWRIPFVHQNKAFQQFYLKYNKRNLKGNNKLIDWMQFSFLRVINRTKITCLEPFCKQKKWEEGWSDQDWVYLLWTMQTYVAPFSLTVNFFESCSLSSVFS